MPYFPPSGGGGGGSVTSVAGKTGVVTLSSADVGLGNVPDTDATVRANQTGTQLASTISDFNTRVIPLALIFG